MRSVAHDETVCSGIKARRDMIDGNDDHTAGNLRTQCIDRALRHGRRGLADGNQVPMTTEWAPDEFLVHGTTTIDRDERRTEAREKDPAGGHATLSRWRGRGSERRQTTAFSTPEAAVPVLRVCLARSERSRCSRSRYSGVISPVTYSPEKHDVSNWLTPES